MGGRRCGGLARRRHAASAECEVAVTDLRKLNVPKALRPVVEEIVGITDAVCLAVLDQEYADLARRAAAKLARKRPSPLVGGRRVTWAAGSCMPWARPTSCPIRQVSLA